ncbi:hypothetical protein FJN14_13670 [Alteromonas mediterranea]|nr:hypothetical protein FJN14_13670 [Alteromonas mediterranea]
MALGTYCEIGSDCTCFELAAAAKALSSTNIAPAISATENINVDFKAINLLELGVMIVRFFS